MKLVRSLARPLLASMFVVQGASALRSPGARTGPAARFAEALHGVAPSAPTDPVLIVRVNAAIDVGAGLMLATNRFSRLSALALAGALVPTTYYGHPFWRETEPEKRSTQKIHFFKNLSMLGGLLLAAVDTEGRPGLAWRTRHAVDHLGDAGHRLAHDASREARLLATKAQLKAHDIAA
jgi:uncharacterized membrane protein YphA (DoxX/SURF4 family)